ncbi:Intraflagellar transport protein 43 [Amphibalanus amphitrite]|uniref:Intraflagellar transport protein 43 n=1 Tax=Amphibalanus amphitrite TaxID=1232801 RepID=A0A6A4W1T6_AMPAM|nr:Intraflagellar transport protein 43 [Amphibalanus amphitrite]
MGKKKRKAEAEAAAAAAAAAAAGAPPAPGPPPQGPPPAAPDPSAAPQGIGRRRRADFDEPAAKAPDSQTDLQPRVTTWDDDDAEAIPMIPDLDEVMEEDLALQVAPAPMAPVNRVATMQELNEDLQKRPAFMTLDGVDLQLIAKCVQDGRDVEEPDKPWAWDVLFTEIMSEVQDEMAREAVSADPTPQPSTTAVDKRSTTAAKA